MRIVVDGERWLQTTYCWTLAYSHSSDVGRDHQELLHCYSPPDDAVKPEYRYKTECRVCKECGAHCTDGYNAAHWSLFFAIHAHLKPGAGPLSQDREWRLRRALDEWESVYLMEV